MLPVITIVRECERVKFYANSTHTRLFYGCVFPGNHLRWD